MENTTTIKLGGAEKRTELPRPGLIELAMEMRGALRGDFSGQSRLEERYPEGFTVVLPFHRIHMLHDPALIEAALVKQHKCYHRDPGSAALRRVMGNGVLTSEDEFHLVQRRLIQPAFHKTRIDAYAETMVWFANDLCKKWEDGVSVDISKQMMEVTLAIIARTMFSFDVAADVATVERCVSTLIKHVARYAIPALGHFLDRFPTKGTREINQALSELDEVIYRFIHAHREGGTDTGDLLSLLLSARYDDGTGMTDQQIRDEATTLFLAGHETTANALNWTWYLLSQNPEVEQRLHEEVDMVLGSGRDACSADMAQLDYTRRVFTEAMRICPTVPGFARMAIQDHELGGYQIRRDDIVVVSQMSTHNSKRWYPEPERFDPDRWLPERAAARPKFAYFPFGGGARKCIGEPFAWMEGILLLATFAREWRFELAPDAVVQMQEAVTLRPAHGLRMIPRRRRTLAQG